MTATSFSIVVLPAHQVDAGVRLPHPHLRVARDNGVLRVHSSDAAGFSFARSGDGYAVQLSVTDWRTLRDAIDKLLALATDGGALDSRHAAIAENALDADNIRRKR